MLAQMAKKDALVVVGGPDHLESSLRYNNKQLPEEFETVEKNGYATLLRKVK